MNIKFLYKINYYKRSMWCLLALYCFGILPLHASDHTQATARLLAWRLQEKLPDFFKNPGAFERYMLREKDERYKNQIVAQLLQPYESAIAAQNYDVMEGHQDAIHTVSWHPQEVAKLASGSADKTVCIWSAMKGLLKRLQGHTDWVQSVAWHPNGKLLASGSADKTVRIWDVQTGKTTHILSEHEDAVNAVSWNADGTRLASGSTDTTIAIWDTKSVD